MLRRIDVGDYPLDLVPLEKDVLSLELEGLFRRVRGENCRRTREGYHLTPCRRLCLVFCGIVPCRLVARVGGRDVMQMAKERGR